MDFEHDDGCDANPAFALPEQPQPEYRVNLTIAVVDPQGLWTAAAAKLLEAPGMTLADALDVIGPREDPSIADCIGALTAPTALAGCIMDDFWIDSLRTRPPSLKVTAPVLGYRAGPAGKEQRRTALTRGAQPHLALCMLPVGFDGTPQIDARKPIATWTLRTAETSQDSRCE